MKYSFNILVIIHAFKEIIVDFFYIEKNYIPPHARDCIIKAPHLDSVRRFLRCFRYLVFQSQAVGDIAHEVLHVGDNALGGQASPVRQLVHREFGDITDVEIGLAHGSVRHHAV